ncbi:hypothetical protein [Pseudobacteriovorax antillogorgiicola]|uniref:Uncharacterized protein n=1 Tax=Pseudobacteriovorax antillogorgiicola TaxID=1513793 RepID=A0A1Y6C9S3_9BACT|nr:hypothetical protein [Pseudobacteriovorax antillogorgiicola]TCS49872.1 hypothetical protein EDD56_114117 [Pseudobacteriovorax antillogorgiicola]SMF43971.1 hypothetical protein SAMN06296036_113116 [Pseudobacteriovorax antillogorgiicola]
MKETEINFTIGSKSAISLESLVLSRALIVRETIQGYYFKHLGSLL